MYSIFFGQNFSILPKFVWFYFKMKSIKMGVVAIGRNYRVRYHAINEEWKKRCPQRWYNFRLNTHTLWPLVYSYSTRPEGPMVYTVQCTVHVYSMFTVPYCLGPGGGQLPELAAWWGWWRWRGAGGGAGSSAPWQAAHLGGVRLPQTQGEQGRGFSDIFYVGIATIINNCFLCL